MSTFGNLGQQVAVGALDVNNQVTPGTPLWVVKFTPEMLPREMEFEVWHGAVRGPGGFFYVYIDNTFYGVGENGRINEYAPSIPMFVRRGQTISLHWSIASGTAPTATLYFRVPEVGK